MKPVLVPGREVVRLEVKDAATCDVVVKHFVPQSLLERMKWGLRQSPAHRAFNLAQRLQALGIRTAMPLAAGERRCLGWFRESFLVTAYVPDATPLYLVNAHCTDRRHRISLVRSMARIYAAVHDAGFHHCDPSQTNFLVAPQRDQEALLLIDLDGLRAQRRTNLVKAANDLRRLLLRCRVPRHERAWFIAQYSRSRKERLDVRDLVARIGTLPAQPSLPFCALNEDGSPAPVPGTVAQTAAAGAQEMLHTQMRRRGGLKWLVRPSRLNLQVESILSAPDQFLLIARILKPSRSSAVSARDGLVLKRYNFRKWSSLFLDLFRGSRARRAFEKALRLELAGIPTARPIAAADQRRFLLPRRSYFLMDEIKGAVPLRSWSGDRCAVCIRVGTLLGRMHREGFTHRDLKEGNIVLDEQGQPHLVDLDGLRYIRRVCDERAAADLARLEQDLTAREWRLSRSHRAHFLVAYCRARNLPDWHWWWRAIQKRLQG